MIKIGFDIRPKPRGVAIVFNKDGTPKISKNFLEQLTDEERQRVEELLKKSQNTTTE